MHRRGPDIKTSVWSVFQLSIDFSSLLIFIVLIDRILGLPFALQAESSRARRPLKPHYESQSLAALAMARGLFSP